MAISVMHILQFHRLMEMWDSQHQTNIIVVFLRDSLECQKWMTTYIEAYLHFSCHRGLAFVFAVLKMHMYFFLKKPPAALSSFIF